MSKRKFVAALPKVKIIRLAPSRWKRGPGGHMFQYQAWRVGKSEKGYGQTALEAMKDLRAKS